MPNVFDINKSSHYRNQHNDSFLDHFGRSIIGRLLICFKTNQLPLVEMVNLIPRDTQQTTIFTISMDFKIKRILGIQALKEKPFKLDICRYSVKQKTPERH